MNLVHVLISHEDLGVYLRDNNIEESIAVVIDTLRATSVMVTALGNGAKMVVPFREIEDARKFKEENKELDVLLGGERKGLKIEGFDLSNSPLDYTRDAIAGRNIVMSTSNGTKTLQMTERAKEVLICSLLNVRAVAEYLKDKKENILIINSGTAGLMSADDYITSGALVSILKKNLNEEEYSYSDSALIAGELFDCKGYDFIEKASHYKNLMKIGYEKDLKYCRKPDQFNIVPVYKDGVIRINK